MVFFWNSLPDARAEQLNWRGGLFSCSKQDKERGVGEEVLFGSFYFQQCRIKNVFFILFQLVGVGEEGERDWDYNDY